MTAQDLARVHRYRQEASNKIDRARGSFVRSLVGTGHFTRSAAGAQWLELLRCEVAIQAMADRQGMLLPEHFRD